MKTTAKGKRIVIYDGPDVYWEFRYDEDGRFWRNADGSEAGSWSWLMYTVVPQVLAELVRQEEADAFARAARDRR